MLLLLLYTDRYVTLPQHSSCVIAEITWSRASVQWREFESPVPPRARARSSRFPAPTTEGLPETRASRGRCQTLRERREKSANPGERNASAAAPTVTFMRSRCLRTPVSDTFPYRCRSKSAERSGWNKSVGCFRFFSGVRVQKTRLHT